ncbi:hypothetical protein ACH5RR_033275 [Cinchona calisaya]|uniref:N-acetyltransferase domain-containing protein n=1 Tax=Cinchona calisaya TaxID=153742 RepID=A0ABD2YLN2_9GENT
MSDTDDLMEWIADEKTSKFGGPFSSKEDVMDYVKNAVIPHKAICLEDNNKAIGWIAVTEYADNKTCIIGYILTPKYWGKGIMTKAVKMVVSNIFIELPHIEKIEACVNVLKSAFSLRSSVTVPKFNEHAAVFIPNNISNNSCPNDHNNDNNYSDIRFRQLTSSDVDDLMAWLADKKTREFWGSFTSKKEAVDYVKDTVIPHKAICMKDDNKPIGCISVTEYEDCKTCRIGYILAPKFWGKGIMTKVVKMVVSNIFIELPHIEKIEAYVNVENIGSQRVLEKVGFTKGMLFGNCHMWILWSPKHSPNI